MTDRAECMLELEMARLEDDFRQILVNNTVPLDAMRLQLISTSLMPSSHCFQASTVSPLDGVNAAAVEEDNILAASLEFDSELDLILVHPAAIYELKKHMIISGYEKECCLVYSSVRRHVLDECLRILGIEKSSIEEMQKMEWTTLHDRMKNWIQVLKILVKRLLIDEKFLCEQVFAGSESMKEVCFVESAKGCVMQMLNFGKALVICNRSSENLFNILDSYDALSDVIPDLEELLKGDTGPGEKVCSEAKVVLVGFCVAASATLLEFEKAILEESSASRMLETGDIHPFTRYVMGYVTLLVDYSEILNGILEKTGYSSEQFQNDELDTVERMPCITRRLLSLIMFLESNLTANSRRFQDGGLQYVFLMNNVLYIVDKLKNPEVRNLLGDLCISKRRDQIRQYALSYLRSSWTKVLDYFNDGFIGKKDLIVSLTNFNACFEDTYRIQTAWKVADPRLQEELRILISESLIPLYHSYVGRYASLIEYDITYLKYTADDLSNYLLDLFEGSPCTIQTNLPKKDWLCLCS